MRLCLVIYIIKNNNNILFKSNIILLNILSQVWTAFKTWLEHWLTDSESTQIDILSQMRSSLITLSWVILIFMLSVLSTGNEVLASAKFNFCIKVVWFTNNFDWFWFLNSLCGIPSCEIFFVFFGLHYLLSCFLLVVVR